MQDQLIPTEKWTFSHDVAAVFDDMLPRSIPGYDEMKRLVFEIGKQFITDNTNIVDFGCANGLTIEPFIKQFKHNEYILNDVSSHMLVKCAERYVKEIMQGIVAVKKHDLRHIPQYSNVSLCLSVLTMQFIPVEYRPYLMNAIYDSLNVGGAFIIVEKVMGSHAELDEAFVRGYYDVKRKNGYSDKQIIAKRESLENVLVPLQADWNISMLQQAGFKKIDCFWRNLNFAAWIAIK